METSHAIALGILIFICGCFAIVLGANFWSMFDHSKWTKDSNPSLDARIIDIQTNTVQYVKNGAKYKTTVRFSDGFIFTTHETNREDNMFSYRISINEELSKHIIENATTAHEKAVRKKFRQNKNQKHPITTREPQKTYSDPFSVYHQKNQVPVKQQQRKQIPAWLSWLIKPHHIVAIIGVIASIALNICVPKENIFYLLAAMGLMLIEYLLMAVINAIWGIPGKILVMLPYFAAMALCIIASLVFQNNPNFDGFDFLARISPFAATVSLTMWANHLWKK